MPQDLDYASPAQSPGPVDDLGRWLFAAVTIVSTALLVITCALWANSYRGTTPAFNARGFALTAPPGPHILFPVPSDYPQYWIPLRGNLERWEHANVGGGWYRWHRGIPLWVFAAIFSIVPAVWLTRRRFRRKPEVQSRREDLHAHGG